MGYLSPGGNYRDTRLVWDEGFGIKSLCRGEKGFWIESKEWGMAEDPKQAVTMALCLAKDRDFQNVILIDYGREGGHLGQAMDVKLEPEETKTFLAFWGLGRSTEAEALKHLTELRSLP
jgi:hypothetical protein